MASAMAAEGFLELTPAAGFSSCGWFSPRISFSRDFSDEEKLGSRPAALEEPEQEESAAADFEFRRLDDSARMLPADELFSDGKLVPLHLQSVRSKPDSVATVTESVREICSTEIRQMRLMLEETDSDPCALYSPKAPRCSSRLRQLLGLKKASQNFYLGKTDSVTQKPPSPSVTAPKTSAARSIRQLLHKSQRSLDSSLSLPLLRDANSDSLSSARLSLSSSSSSGPEHEDLPRLSLDSAKSSRGGNLPKVRLVPKPKPSVEPSLRSNQVLGTSLDSPRMNPSGKVVFHGLERSSSSPSTFNGVPRVKHRGVERSYSANVVRVPPVLNVPLYSLRGSSKSGSIFGLGHLFPPRNSHNGSKSSKIVRGI